MKLEVARSKKDDGFKAGKHVGKEIFSDDLKIVYLFASTDYDLEKVLEGVSKEVEVPVVGCSSTVEVGNDGFDKGSIVAGGFSGNIDVGVGLGENIDKNSYKAGKKAIKDAFNDLESEEVTPFSKKRNDGWKKSQDFFVNVFADPLTGSGVDILEGINDFLGPGFSVTGEFAADNMEFKKTYVFFNGNLKEKSVVCTAFKVDKKVGSGSAHGFKPTPNEFEVTESEGNLVSSLEGNSPKEVYADIFGEEKAVDPGFLLMAPFGMKKEGEEEFTIRVALDVNEEGGYVCGADVPQNIKVRLMMGEKKSLLKASKNAAIKALEDAGLERGDVSAAILFSCVGRDAIYNDPELTKKEIRNVREELGEDVDIIGIYGFGQIAPKKGFAEFKEETLSIQIVGK